MFNAFMADKSPFKTRMVITVLLSLASIGASFCFSQLYMTQTAENDHLRAEYTAQSQWLTKFDYRDATNLYKMVLKPCKRADLDSVQADQTSILTNHNLTILSVKNDTPVDKPDKKTHLKYRKSTVHVAGQWNDIMSALSEFEKEHLVVITDYTIALNDQKNASEPIKATLTYNVYFN